jgi:hypothetical protein
MILQDILLNVRKYLDDDASASAGALQRWSDAELIFYINNAYIQYYNELISTNYDGFLKRADLDITANSDLITLPAKFFKMRSLERKYNNTYIPLEYIRNYDYTTNITSQGEGMFIPSYDFMSNSTGDVVVKLSMIPSFSETAGLRLYYWETLTKLSSALTDEPIGILKEQFVDLIILRSAIWAKGGREEDDVSNLAQMLGRVEDNFNEFKTKITNARSYVEAFITDF